MYPHPFHRVYMTLLTLKIGSRSPNLIISLSSPNDVSVAVWS